MTATALRIAGIVLAVGASGAVLAQPTSRSTFQDTNGKQIGTATLAQTPNGVLVDMFDKDGSALVVHAKPDDYRSQPSGDAGDRIACAVIERPSR